MTTVYGVVIPAHDEVGSIAATLSAIMVDAGIDVVVVCNGCSDDTASVARRVAPSARVVELPAVGKAGAINYGLSLVRPGTVLVVDADTQVTRDALDAVANALNEPGVAAASPAPAFDLTHTDRWVRAYYRAFAGHVYLTRGVGGSGVWGLSAAGRTRLGKLPPVIADDGYVRHFFSIREQRRVRTTADGSAVCTIVHPPATLAALIRTEARWRAGDAQVRALLGRESSDDAGDTGAFMARLVAGNLADYARYALVKVAGRLMLLHNRCTGTASLWHRDRRPA